MSRTLTTREVVIMRTTIEEAESLMEDQAVLIALLQEENAELREENKLLRGRLSQMMTDRRVDFEEAG